MELSIIIMIFGVVVVLYEEQYFRIFILYMERHEKRREKYKFISFLYVPLRCYMVEMGE